MVLVISGRLPFLYYPAVLDRYTLHPLSHFPVWWRPLHAAVRVLFKHLVSVSSRHDKWQLHGNLLICNCPRPKRLSLASVVITSPSLFHLHSTDHSTDSCQTQARVGITSPDGCFLLSQQQQQMTSSALIRGVLCHFSVSLCPAEWLFYITRLNRWYKNSDSLVASTWLWAQDCTNTGFGFWQTHTNPQTWDAIT